MRSLLIRCYPAHWRVRYGDEFMAILEERPLGPFDVADILLGALDAQLRPRGHGATREYERGFTMTLRIGGIAAILFAITFAAFMFQMTPGTPFGGIAAILAVAGLLALLVAVTGLSAYQARSDPTRVWTAFGITATGTVAVAFGALVELTPLGAGSWNQVMVGLGILAAIVGATLFGFATYQNSPPLRNAAALIVAAPGIIAAAFVVASVSLVGLAYFLMLLAAICFLTGWAALGVQAIRLDRTRVASDPV